jgi:hypothetical protein
MKKKILSICAWVSAMLFIVFVGLYIYAWVFDPNLYPMNLYQRPPRPFFLHIPLGNATMAVDKYDGGQVVFFNGPEPNDRTSSGIDNQTGWGFYGIECRLMSVNDPAVKTWWTLRISLWYPIILFGILPAIFAVKKWRGRKSASTQKTVIEK